jgi:hypothetical protein
MKQNCLLTTSEDDVKRGEQANAKSFMETTPHVKKHAQYISGNCSVFNVNSGNCKGNNMVDSVNICKQDNNDMFNVSKSINENTNPIEEDVDDDDCDEYVNTRVMMSQGMKVSQSTCDDNNNNKYNIISLSGSFMKSKDTSKHIVVKEEERENDIAFETKPSFTDINNDNPFLFSSPHVDAINGIIEQRPTIEKKATQDIFEEIEQQPVNLKRTNCLLHKERTLKFALPKQIITDDSQTITATTTNLVEPHNDLEIINFPEQSQHINNINDNNPPLPASSIETPPPNEQHALFTFLSEINMEKHFNTLISAGYDNIQLYINQMKRNNSFIKDCDLQSIGLTLPGERAKILIYIQDKAKCFPFTVPKKVYYTSPTPNDPNSDSTLKKLDNWLTGLKLHNYLMKFINNGYHSLDLLLLQMQSKHPLTESILENEIGVDKPGYRAIILNSLNYEGQTYYKKNKLGVIAIDSKGDDNHSCECVIY